MIIMMRTCFSALLVSCIVGALLGWGIAYGFLSVNAWQLEYETQSYEILAESAFAHVTNPNAKASIEETTHYFGVMDVKASGSHDFFIKNVGTEDLILKVDRTTCSCTGIDITPMRVPPGKSAKCLLRYNAEQAMIGKFSQGGIVMTNDPDNREIRLIVEGVFTNPVVVQPTSVNLSRVPTGASKTVAIRFYGFENEPLVISAPTWEDREHFDFQWETAQISESDEADAYLSAAKSVVAGTLTLKPGLPVGPIQEWFQVKTNFASQSSTSFRVSGQIVGNVSISGQGYNREKEFVEMGNTVSGKSISRGLLIEFSGLSAPSATVQVQTVEPAWIRTNLSQLLDVSQRRIFSLTIEIPDNAPTGSYVFGGDGRQAYITLETNDENMPILRIPLQFVVGRQ